MAPLTKKRIWIATFILILMPLGFLTKYTAGLAELWIHNHAGGILYEIFWCLIILFTLPQAPIRKIAIAVFAMTSMLEILQLWHPPFLTAIRQTMIGHIIFGSRFDLWDFPHYVLGCWIAYIWMKKVNARLEKDKRE